MGNSATIDPYGRTDAERTELKAKVDKANVEARDNWDNPAWRHSMAQQMAEAVYRGFEHENLLGLFADVENAPFDGRVFVKETRGLKAFWVARGGYIEASNLYSQVMEIPRDTIGFHVYEMEDKLRTNFAETQQTLIRLAGERMDAQINARLFSLFQAAVPTTSPYYTTGASLSLTALNSALRRIRDETGQHELAIIGRITMTDLIIEELATSNYAAFVPETNEQMLRRGVLGTYRGARVITLRNFDDDTRTPFFPANELWVVGAGASKFAFWGGLLSKEYVENDNWYWHFLARRDFGGTVFRPERLHRIVNTSIPAYSRKAS